MTTVVDAITATRIIVSLPALGVDAGGQPRSPQRAPLVVEVCAQEGLDIVAVPVADLTILDLMEPLGGRVIFGASGVVSADQLAEAADRGSRFVMLNHASEALLAQAAERGVAAFACAFTPHEISDTWAMRPDAVVVHPAEVLGTLYAPHAIAAAPGAPVIAGGTNSYVAQQWLTKGAFAATTDESFISDTLVDGNLGWLRDRARTFATEGRAAPAWRAE